MLVACRPPRPVAALDQRSAFLIAYGDHVQRSGEAPLVTLAGFVEQRLAPQVTGVHTLPIHPSTSDGGFAVVDHSVVDPALGSWDDVSALACTTRWMADAVVNHVSASSPWLAGYLAGDPAFAGFFRPLPDAADVSAVVRPRTSPLGHEFRRDDGSAVRLWTTFSADQVDLDLASPEVFLALTDVVLRFVAEGAAAIRLDAVAFAWKDPARSSMSLPETHDVVACWRACLDEVAPGCVLVTETNVPHDENVTYFGTPERPEAHAVYQFPLPPLVLHTMLTGDSTALVGWLRALDPPPQGCAYLAVLSTHDGIGLRGSEGVLDDAQRAALAAATEACGGQVNRRATPAGPVAYELCTTWYSILAHGHDHDAAMARHVASHAIALAVQGVPLLYFGAVMAATNDHDRLAATGHRRDLNRTRFDAEALGADLDDPASRAALSWTALRGLLERRASCPAFAPQAHQVVHPVSPDVVVIERIAPTGERAAVCVNVTPAAVTVEVPAWGTVRLSPWGVNIQIR